MPDVAAPPVVLAHGCGGSPDAAFVRTGWTDAFKRAGRDPVLLVLPGHGRGTQSHDPATYDDLSRSLGARMPKGVIDAVGFSLGAKLLLEIAIREPQRIRRLVLGGLGDNAFAPEAIGEVAASALEHGATEQTPPPVREFLDTWEPGWNDALAIAAVLRRPPNPVFDDEQLEALSLPILLVNGTEDPVGRNSERLRGALKTAAVRTLPAAGHFDLTAQPEFVRLAIDFLGHAGPSETGAHQ